MQGVDRRLRRFRSPAFQAPRSGPRPPEGARRPAREPCRLPKPAIRTELAMSGVTTRTSSALSTSSRTPKGSASALSAASPAAISRRVGIARTANHALAEVGLSMQSGTPELVGPTFALRDLRQRPRPPSRRLPVVHFERLAIPLRDARDPATRRPTSPVTLSLGCSSVHPCSKRRDSFLGEGSSHGIEPSLSRS